MLCGGMRRRLPLVHTSSAGLLLEGCVQCSDHVLGAWQTRSPLTPAGFVLGHIAPERHVIVCPVSPLFCYPEDNLYAGASSGDLTVRAAVKRFQAVVHWAKVRGSRLVFCCLPAFSAAGSWLVCCSVSDVDGAQGFGLRSSWNSMNWFAQIFSLT